MNDLLRKFALDEPEALDYHFDAYCRSYRNREDALIMVRQLLLIAKAAQRHRGMTMTQLAGNPTFDGDFAALQLQIEKRLFFVCALGQQTQKLLSIQDQQNLLHAWRTIKNDWQDDDVVDNFELHSHFIEQVHTRIQSLSRAMELPISAMVADSVPRPITKAGVQKPEGPGGELAASDNSTAVSTESALDKVLSASDVNQERYPIYFKQIELLDFIAGQIPAMIEQVARIRGLASYSVAKGVCEDLQRGKIRFAISSARSLSEKLRQQSNRIANLMGKEFSSLKLVQTFEMKLMYLLGNVQDGVLGSEVAIEDSGQLFRAATDVIDAYLKVVEDGFTLLRRWHEDDLEAWLRINDDANPDSEAINLNEV